MLITCFLILKVVSFVLQKTILVNRSVGLTHAFLLILCLFFHLIWLYLEFKNILLNTAQWSMFKYSSMFSTFQVALPNF